MRWWKIKDESKEDKNNNNNSYYNNNNKNKANNENKIESVEVKNLREAYSLDSLGDVKIVITDKYQVIAPPIPENFENILEDVVIEYTKFGEGDEEERLLGAFLEVATRRKINTKTKDLWYHIKNACLYYNKLTPLFFDENIEDISCSGPYVPVYVYHKKYGFIPTNISFDREELQRFIHSLAQRSGFILSLDNPIVDATLPNGSRINIVLSIAREPSFTIRKVKSVPITPKSLTNNGTIPAELAALLWLAMENRCSIMFIGGTAAGKTTIMNATAFFIPLNSKIVSIEDTYEIVLPHKNWTALIVRGNITAHELLKATLRQRPEYIIIGEARGIEVREMFSAMGVGHAVLTTFHGASAQSVAKRLFGEPFMIKSDQFQLLDFILTMNLTSEKKRKCTELMLVGEGDVRLVADVFGTKIFTRENKEEMNLNLTPALKRIAEKGMKSVNDLKKDFEKKLEIINKLPEDFQKFIATLCDVQLRGEA